MKERAGVRGWVAAVLRRSMPGETRPASGAVRLRSSQSFSRAWFQLAGVLALILVFFINFATVSVDQSSVKQGFTHLLYYQSFKVEEFYALDLFNEFK